MGSIIDKLTYVKHTKELIRQAIIGRGVNVSSAVPFRDYPYLILTINNRGGMVTESDFFGDDTVAGKLTYLEETKYLIRQAIQQKGVTVPLDATFRDYAGLIASIVPDSDSGGDVDDGLVDYNGVMLPDVSPYITEQYPDAAILRLANTSTYYLVVIGGEWDFVHNGNNISASVESISITYVTTEGGSAWTKRSQDSSVDSGSVELVGGVNTVIWSNFDIPTEDDGGGDDTTATKYSFNGTVLPALPEWDSETYPYALISKAVSREYYFRAYSDRIVIFSGLSGGFADGEAEQIYCVLSDDVWGEFTTITVDGFTAINVVWTNTDILYENGNVYLAASEPIPVYE